MNWMGLSPVEIAALWTALSSAALWLYLHHRRPQRRRVSTLRFWASVQPISQPKRRHLREPWALLAQVIFLLLLVAALGNPQWGAAVEGRSVAMVLDDSIWAQTRPAGEPSWLEQERAEALRVVDSLPRSDRVLLLRAEAEAAPLLPFTTDREALRRAILNLQPTSAPADLPSALEVGRAAVSGTRRGLLVYVGPGLVDAEQSRRMDELRSSLEAGVDHSGAPQFLIRLVGNWAAVQNRGITRVSLQRDAARPDEWHLLAQIKNYGATRADVTLKISVGGEPLGSTHVSLAPQQIVNTEEQFAWDKGGMLQAEIDPPDALDADNRALVNIPSFRTVRVALFAMPGSGPSLGSDLLTVLSSNPYVQAQMVPPGLNPDVPLDVAIYEVASVPEQTKFNSIYFLRGAEVANSRSLRVIGWNAQHPVTRWVRTRDISVRNPASLKVEPGDTILAYAEGDPPQPLILARQRQGLRILIVGFNPHDSNFPLESAFPMLMAGSLEWMTRSVEEVANSRSAGELDLPGPATKVTAPSGKDVPFALIGSDIHLLADETGLYRVATAKRETSVAVNAPVLPAERLQVSADEQAEPERESLPVAIWSFWRWLVLLAIVALWIEWKLFYAARKQQSTFEGGRVHPGEPQVAEYNSEPERTSLRGRNVVTR